MWVCKNSTSMTDTDQNDCARSPTAVSALHAIAVNEQTSLLNQPVENLLVDPLMSNQKFILESGDQECSAEHVALNIVHKPELSMLDCLVDECSDRVVSFQNLNAMASPKDTYSC